jgi:hypothetical protein
MFIFGAYLKGGLCKVGMMIIKKAPVKIPGLVRIRVVSKD